MKRKKGNQIKSQTDLAGSRNIWCQLVKWILFIFFSLRFLVDGLSYPGFNFFWYIVFSLLTAGTIICFKCEIRLRIEEGILLLFFCLCLLSANFSPVKEVKYEFPSQILSFWMILFLLLRTVQQKDKEKFWWVILGSALLVTLYGIHQHFWGLEQTRRELAAHPELLSSLPPTFLHRLQSGRIFSTFFYPNALASFLLMVFPVAYSGCFLKGKTSVFSALLVLLTVANLFLTGSVGGFLIFAFLLQFLALKYFLPRKFFWQILSGLLVLEAAVLVFSYHRGVLPHMSSFQDRIRYWQATVKIFQRYPWLGVGPGQFRHFYLRFKSPGGMEARHAHSFLFETLAEEGLIGTCVFFFFLLFLIWKLLRMESKILTLKEGMAIGFLAGFAHFLIDVSFIDESVSSLFFLLAGLGLAENSLPAVQCHSRLQQQLTKALSCLIILLLTVSGIIRVRMAFSETCVSKAYLTASLKERMDYLVKANSFDPGSEKLAYLADAYVLAWSVTGDKTWLRKAEESYQQALSLNPYAASICRKLARLYVQEKRWREAEKLYLQCLENYPTKKQYVLELALLYKQLGDEEKYSYYFSRSKILPAVTKEEDNYVSGILNGENRSDRDTPGGQTN